MKGYTTALKLRELWKIEKGSMKDNF